jgi:biopolymer transport protein TolQ
VSFDLFNSNLLTLIIAAGPVTKIVLLILLMFSVTSWAIIFYKWRVLRRAIAENRRFRAFFRKLEDLADLKMRAQSLTYSPLAGVFLEVYAYLRPHLDAENGRELSMRSVQGWLRTAVEVQIIRFEQYLSFLATTGNVSPFIGLFGTVLGIMESFQAIGRLGTASIAAVAPGVAEALLATAAGLLAAIPAVVAYNYYVSRIKILAGEMETFSAEFINRVEERVSRVKTTIP